MILPHPESNLRTNLMVLGAEIISVMNEKSFKGKYVLVDDVMGKFLKGDKKRTPDLFLYAITFLYTIGIVERKGHKIKLIKHNNRQLNLF